MFNGIIFNSGKVKKILVTNKGKSIFIFSKLPLTKKILVCQLHVKIGLTLVSVKRNIRILSFK